MPQVYPTPRDHTPTGVYSSTGNGGCRTIYRNDATAAPYGYQLVDAASAARRSRAGRRPRWPQGRWSHTTTIHYRRDTFFVPLQNALFALGGAFGVIPGKDGYLDGRLLTRNASGVAEPFAAGERVQDRRRLVPDRRRRLRVRARRAVPVHLRTRLRRPRRPGGARRREPAAVDHEPPLAALPLRRGARRGHGRLPVPEDPTRSACRARSTARTTRDRFGCGHSDDGEATADDAGGIVARHLAALLPPTARLDSRPAATCGSTVRAIAARSARAVRRARVRATRSSRVPARVA